jgi:hypothetical protein
MRTPPQPTSRGRWREEECPQAVGKRQKAPQQTEGCALETRGELLLETLTNLQPELYGGSCLVFH